MFKKILNPNNFIIKLLVLWIIVLSILYSTLSVIRHNNFQSGAFDLGIYDQAVWQYSKFIYPFNTIKDRFILGDHLTLTLPLLSPLFYIWDNVRILLIFQAFWVSLSTLAVYKLTRVRKFSTFVAFCISITYSLFYGIQFLIFFDFHPVGFAVGAIPWMLYFLETQKKKLFVFAVILILLTQENMGLALASIGLYYVFKAKFRRTAIFFVLGGVIYSLAASKIIANFSPVVGFQYWPQISTDPVKIIASFFDAPEKRQVLLYSFSTFTFLPLISPGAVLAVFFDLAQYFATGSEFSRMWSPFMHHRAILAPFLLLGALDGLAFFQKRKISPSILAAIILVSSLFQQYIFHFPLNKLSKPSYVRQEPWMKNTRKIISLVPKEASVASQQNLVPHLSHRRQIHLVWPRNKEGRGNPCGTEGVCWWLDYTGKPEYLVVDVHPNSWITQLLETNENFESAVKNMKRAGKIKVYKNIGDAYIYKILPSKK